MNILPNEVESIKTIGSLHGSDVKMIKTFGGFYIAVGKKSKSAKNTESLAAGSHPALVIHQVSEQFSDHFKKTLMKSEADNFGQVIKKSEFLPEKLFNDGYDFSIIQKNEKVEFILTRYGIINYTYTGKILNKNLICDNHTCVGNFKLTRELADSMARATIDEFKGGIFDGRNS